MSWHLQLFDLVKVNDGPVRTQGMMSLYLQWLRLQAIIWPKQARRAIKGISSESVPAAAVEGAELDGRIFTDDLLLSLFESTMS